MYNVSMAIISGGSGMRSNFFSSHMGDVFGRGQGAQMGRSLGQTGVGTYTQVKADIARWDSLVERLRRVANQSARDQIATQFGINNPANKDKGQYLRDRSAYHVSQAESSTPINYDIFAPNTPGPAPKDAADLESFLGDFQTAVQNAEGTYGLLAAPQTITNYVNTTPTWVLPVAVGVGALGLLALLGVIKI